MSITGLNEKRLQVVLQEIFPDSPYLQQQVRKNVVKTRSHNSNMPKTDSGMPLSTK